MYLVHSVLCQQVRHTASHLLPSVSQLFTTDYSFVLADVRNSNIVPEDKSVSTSLRLPVTGLEFWQTKSEQKSAASSVLVNELPPWWEGQAWPRLSLPFSPLEHRMQRRTKGKTENRYQWSWSQSSRLPGSITKCTCHPGSADFRAATV